MRISCNIIQDLLPLYYDNVCSKESKEMIEEHIKECNDCNHKLEIIKEKMEPHKIDLNETKIIKKIASIWENAKRKSFIKGAFITLVIFMILIGGYIGLTKIKFIPVSTDLIEVSEISRLKDGRIVYHLNVKDDKTLHFIKFTTKENGEYYITPMRSIIEKKRSTEAGIYNEYFQVDIAENNAWQQDHGDGIVINSCYIGTQEDNILLWKEGIELPSASEELEIKLN